MRPAAFLASSVLLPAFSAQASGSVADAEAAETASPLQEEATASLVQVEVCALAGARAAEGFAAAQVVGSVPSQDGSAVALPADDSILPAASASLLPVEGFAAAQAVGSVSSQDGSAVALPADDSVLPEWWDAAGD